MEQSLRPADSATPGSASSSPLFCAVIEPDQNWLHSAALLVYSLRVNGGKLRSAPAAVLIAGLADSIVQVGRIAEANLTVYAAPSDPVLPHLNKTSALSLSDHPGVSHIMLLDHDTVILHLNGISSLLTGEVRARRNYKYGLTRTIGRGYASALNLPGVRPWSRIHYFNSGVIVVPCRHAAQLRARWRAWTSRLLPGFNDHPVSEQIGFSMALAATPLPYGFLPRIFNQTNWHQLENDAAIIHYNSFDPVNRYVKREVMHSFSNLRTFLNTTDNRFWRAYGAVVEQLLTPELDDLAYRLVAMSSAHDPVT